MWKINGTICVDEKAVRDYAFNYTKKGFNQDFRLVNGAYKLPLIQLIELFEKLGHTVEEVEQK